MELGPKCRLKSVATPYTGEDLASLDSEPAGLLAPVNASHLMRLMFAARVARPDLVPAITRLSRFITRWKQRHDFALVRIFSYLESSISLCLHGSLPLNCSDLELHCWPDADLAGEKGDSKSTGGYFVELHANGHTWPLGWQSKRQTSTAISTAESETISLQRCMHKEALPIQEFLNFILKHNFLTIILD